MKVDNFENIKNILQFKKGLYVFITIYKRRKDNPDMQDQMHAVKHYYVDSFEYLDKIKEEIITLCETFNARAYISYSMRKKSKFISSILLELSKIAYADVNSFNFTKLALTSENIFRQIKPNRNDSFHMIDCDGEFGHKYMPDVMDIIKNAGATEIHTIPSVTGTHILYKGANTREIDKFFSDCTDEFNEYFDRKGTTAYTLLYSNLK